MPVLNKAGALFEQIKEAAQAVGVYERVLELAPDDRDAAIRIFDLKMAMCDWDDYGEICRAQIRQIESGAGNLDVFNLQALPVDYAFIGKAARRAAIKIAADARQDVDAPPLVHAAPRGGRIRLGYALAYTWFHSLPLVHKEIVALHDRERFEVFGYSVRPSDGSRFCAEYGRIVRDGFNLHAIDDLGQLCGRIGEIIGNWTQEVDFAARSAPRVNELYRQDATILAWQSVYEEAAALAARRRRSGEPAVAVG